MAKYFLRIKVFSRGKGARATRAAAYRAGERIHDERTGEFYNFTEREGVVHKEIVLPSQFAISVDMDWARDRSTLWNAAEHAGRRRNSRVAREVLVILPPELTPAQRVNLVRTFSRELADKYQNAVDVAVHEPRRGSDERHHHAHMLMTTREVTPKGLGPRTTIELGNSYRFARGLGPTRDDYFSIRKQWAQATNAALREAGLESRVDHRSYKDQGIDREPTPAMPQKVYYAERRSGLSTQAGDAIRARHRERVEARLKGGDELARIQQRQREEDRQRAIESSKRKEGLPKRIPTGALARKELNQKRRERYQRNLETIRQKKREWRRVRAAEINERRKQLYHANRDELNRKRREHNKAARAAREAAQHSSMSHGQQQAKAKRPQESTNSWFATRENQAQAPTAEESAKSWLAFHGNQKPPPTAEESAKSWLALQEGQKQPPTAEESAKNWLALRGNQKQPTAEESAKSWLALQEGQKQPPTAEESAKNWLAFRESQKLADPSQTAAQDRSHEREAGGDDDREDDQKRANRGRDHDAGL
jgi:hypothetical protein